jgi:hypothetical protein
MCSNQLRTEEVFHKKLAVLSDIHGNLPALEAVAADLQDRNVAQVVNLAITHPGRSGRRRR